MRWIVYFNILFEYFIGNKGVSCPGNMAACKNTTECILIEKFCDGVPDCPNKSDEGAFCRKLAAN